MVVTNLRHGIVIGRLERRICGDVRGCAGFLVDISGMIDRPVVLEAGLSLLAHEQIPDVFLDLAKGYHVDCLSSA